MLGSTYPLLRRWLFTRDAEESHDFALKWLSKLGQSHAAWMLKQNVEQKPVELMGIKFPNPVGLAAGLDKNANAVDAFGKMGFGFVEVGTVTPRPQLGNPKPRMFRLPEAHAIINRMGFNNGGLDLMMANLERTKYKGVLGINIGKNKDTPENKGAEDFRLCLERVYSKASYITVNVSSPNTPGLRDMQHGEQLVHLLKTVKAEQAKQADIHQKYVPVVVKIAPDLSKEAVFSLADVLLEEKIDGVIATNTTLERSAVAHLNHAQEAGGLSGRPLQEQSVNVISWLREHCGKDFPIIGVGGIEDPVTAADKFNAGANLIQLYTGFIYQGPSLIPRIINSLGK
ncbi:MULTISPECIES: quinone-dependent dihydroorotate dehydrogenase [Gammaproteobacteria]|uniref:quinone-dependent dihydroorotate dehydrogenase n=1 Tax=Gammaproteobacteria TaxID=1236 RepID=UPI000DD0A858|nr:MULTISPECIES: quinone-dependent dihydroorotate dehydrogenase [Gammaproteobacteria]RTE87216.1 quinone-dependent dihydroorotate dehydrogenase [Aliidiomarina sp. B3213]TCZ92996.1 quinone-dependent dihydroorotate dehydrogenase [Lysobacter sp. N42]